jgi:hypothetical protein
MLLCELTAYRIFTEHFWTFLDFFGLLLTQPANDLSFASKKQPKTASSELTPKTS